jgi:hypothetical protein
MYKKIEPLILKPISNPEELKEMLAFSDDNVEGNDKIRLAVTEIVKGNIIK